MTNTADDAADLTHDTFLLSGHRWTGLTLEGRSNPGSMVIARNVWRKHCAARVTRGIDPPEWAPKKNRTLNRVRRSGC